MVKRCRSVAAPTITPEFQAEMEKKRRTKGGLANGILSHLTKTLLKSFCLNLKTFLQEDSWHM